MTTIYYLFGFIPVWKIVKKEREFTAWKFKKNQEKEL